MLQQFIAELNWPDEVLASHLMKRLKLMASDMVQSCVKRYALTSTDQFFFGHHQTGLPEAFMIAWNDNFGFWF